METRLNIPDCTVLWQNDKWSIELLPCRKQIAVPDSWTVDYGFYHRQKDILYWDAVTFPKYVHKKALALAKKCGMISIYCD